MSWIPTGVHDLEIDGRDCQAWVEEWSNQGLFSDLKTFPLLKLRVFLDFSTYTHELVCTDLTEESFKRFLHDERDCRRLYMVREMKKILEAKTSPAR